MKEIKAYKCEFCGFKLERKNAMEKHELYCSKNPKNFFDCNYCRHLKETKTEIDYGDNYDNEPIVKNSKSFYCEALNKKLYPLIVVKKGLNIKYKHTFQDQELFKHECEIHRSDNDNVMFKLF
jgi:hypothetical protein